ncbi:helix-turn-helix domain-containing protein [Actinomadura sp. 21ATH]|uniref:helix-turn-helix domain-containing protein n=1 Tax=Actinomadura sp. 21ATH TaxID=1735444 RepID=UPI0035C103A1
MSASPRPSVRQRRLAAELRRMREQLTYTGDDVAERLHWSTAKVSRLENARTGAKLADVRLLLDLYGVDGERRDEILALARDAAERGWWEDYRDLPGPYAEFIGMEAEAHAVTEWGSMVVPGLLQTERYARQVIEGWNAIATLTPAELDRRVEVRMRRQELLGEPRRLELSVVMDEAVLFRRVGDRDVMREQLDHLHRVTELPNVKLRILPLDTPHEVIAESFILLEFPPAYDTLFPDIVHTESLTISHFVDEAVTYMYRLAYDTLAARALSHTESRQRILQARNNW